MWQESFQKALIKEFKRLNEGTDSVSLRKWAKALDLAPSTLSQLLNGSKQWRLTTERAVQILAKMELRKTDRNRLLAMIGAEVTHDREELKTEDFAILTDWTYYPILNSFYLDEKLRAPKLLAKRFGIDENKVVAVIADLLKRGLLVEDANGKISPPEKFIQTGEGPTSEVLFQYHENNLRQAARALREIPRDQRDVTALTFAGNSEQIEFLRKEIRKLYTQASALMTSEKENDEVFQLSIQLYPVRFEKK